MENDNIESVETQEVAEPELDVETPEEESVETQEVAEPEEAEETEETEDDEDGRTEADAAFAEQRRRIKELETQNSKMIEALSRYFDGETAEDLSIAAQAYAEQRDPDEVRAEYEAENLRSENEDLKQQLESIQIAQLMEKDLQAIQQIDPTVKSLNDLGEGFFKMVAAGLSGKEAYYAVKAQELNEKVLAPSAIGAVADTKVERDYYTSEELDNLSDEEMDANWDKVMKSMARLGK